MDESGLAYSSLNDSHRRNSEVKQNFKSIPLLRQQENSENQVQSHFQKSLDLLQKSYRSSNPPLRNITNTIVNAGSNLDTSDALSQNPYTDRGILSRSRLTENPSRSTIISTGNLTSRSLFAEGECIKSNAFGSMVDLKEKSQSQYYYQTQNENSSSESLRIKELENENRALIKEISDLKGANLLSTKSLDVETWQKMISQRYELEIRELKQQISSLQLKVYELQREKESMQEMKISELVKEDDQLTARPNRLQPAAENDLFGKQHAEKKHGSENLEQKYSELWQSYNSLVEHNKMLCKHLNNAAIERVLGRRGSESSREVGCYQKELSPFESENRKLSADCGFIKEDTNKHPPIQSGKIRKNASCNSSLVESTKNFLSPRESGFNLELSRLNSQRAKETENKKPKEVPKRKASNSAKKSLQKSGSQKKFSASVSQPFELNDNKTKKSNKKPTPTTALPFKHRKSVVESAKDVESTSPITQRTIETSKSKRKVNFRIPLENVRDRSHDGGYYSSRI